jgi:hypothetical protein
MLWLLKLAMGRMSGIRWSIATSRWLISRMAWLKVFDSKLDLLFVKNLMAKTNIEKQVKNMLLELMHNKYMD